jgi:hypothetical protein
MLDARPPTKIPTTYLGRAPDKSSLPLQGRGGNSERASEVAL